jgi:hypothetical protein
MPGSVAPNSLLAAGSGLLSSAAVAALQTTCHRCNRSFPDAKSLRDHVVTVHGIVPPGHQLASLLNGNGNGPVSPPGGLAVPGITDIFGSIDGVVGDGNKSSGVGGDSKASKSRLMCIQCGATFLSRDQLKKHELLHSPSGQVVSHNTE